MTLYRKIGGIHWFALGPVRISICLVRAKRGSAQARRKPTTAQKLAWVRAALESEAPLWAVRNAMFDPTVSVPTIEDWVRLNEQEPSVPEGLEAQGDGTAFGALEDVNSVLADIDSEAQARHSLPRITTFPWPPEAKV